MTPVTLHIDRPDEVELIIERDTTPKLDFLIYEDEDQTVEVDVSDFSFELYLKANLDVDNDDAPLKFTDADFVKQPGSVVNLIRAPITRLQSNDDDVLLPEGVWILYWTDSSGHVERLIRGTFRAQK